MGGDCGLATAAEEEKAVAASKRRRCERDLGAEVAPVAVAASDGETPTDSRRAEHVALMGTRHSDWAIGFSSRRSAREDGDS